MDDSDHSIVKCETGELPPAVEAAKTPVIESCGFEAADEAVKNAIPSLQPSGRGVITIRLPFGLTVEVTNNEDVRVIGKQFQMLSMKNGNQLGILHPNGRVFCDENEVHASFSEVSYFTSKHSLMKTIGQKVKSSRFISADKPDGLKFQAILRQNEIFFHSSMMSETVHMTGRKRPSKTAAVAFPEVKLDTLSKLIHGTEEKPTMKSYCEVIDEQSSASYSQDRRLSPIKMSYCHEILIHKNAKHDDRSKYAYNDSLNHEYRSNRDYRQNYSNGYGSQESNDYWDYEEDDCYEYKSDFEFANFVREEERYHIDEEERWEKHADEVAHLADEFDRIRLPDERYFDQHIHETKTKKVEPQLEEIDDLQKYSEQEIIDFIRLHPRNPYTDTREHEYDPRLIADQIMDDVDKPIGPMPRHRSMSVDIFERDVTAPGSSNN
ncbi:hypothetical protein M3Y96_00299900 [Aphelenchoides besseyi]|nr:hypothetical protein M3Y96_00299900 [Aphelenchoides besseyi]